MLDGRSFHFGLSFFYGRFQSVARPRLHPADRAERDRDPEQLPQELLRSTAAEMIDAGQHRHHGDKACAERR